jgi:hypothetical protein
MNVETLTTFFGWCTVINLGIFLVAAIKIMVMRDWASKIHAKMFKIDEESVRQMYFQFLALYKIAFVTLNLVPYVALKIMSGS